MFCITKLVYAAILMQLIACLCFLYGFICDDEDKSVNYETNQSVKFRSDEQIQYIEKFCDDTANQTEPVFDKLVFILVDALRSDMVPSVCDYSSHRNQLNCPATPSMPFVEQQLTQFGAIGFNCEVNMPTLTMPRIKALMTGHLSAFMDSILNFNPEFGEFHGDSLINQANEMGKRIIFAGDDVWTNLFPKALFHRTHPSPSFHVTDYVHCDNYVSNMTRMELDADDWDFLLLHYLGECNQSRMSANTYSK